MKTIDLNKGITLLFAGDLIPYINSTDIFSEKLLKILKDKDFSIVNLESPLTRSNEQITKNGKAFKGSPAEIKSLLNGCFDAVALSNNHIRDFGGQGIIDTIDTCRNNNILTVGAGSNLKEASTPLRVNIKGIKISYLNYSEKEFNYATERRGGANPFDLIEVVNQLKAEKEENDFVIVVYHGGIEYHHLPSFEIVRLFRFIIETGADCIISHHTHRYSGLVYHHGKPIFFGLGNLLSATKSKRTKEWLIGTIAKICIEDKRIIAEIIPTKMRNDFSSVDIMSLDESNVVKAHIAELSGIILDENKLKSYWQKENLKYKRKVMDRLISNTLTGYRLRKNLPLLFRSGFTQFRLLNVMNILNCYSHRERLLHILEETYDKNYKN